MLTTLRHLLCRGLILAFGLVAFAAPVAAVTPGLAGGQNHSLMLKADGSVWAWGDNQYGQLGDGGTLDRGRPVRVAGFVGVQSVAARGSHSLVLANGRVWAWGINNFGQLGNGNRVNQSRPIAVSGLAGIVAIAAGDAHSLAVRNDGTVWAWGQNSLGQLGDGGASAGLLPVQVTGLTGIVAVAAGAFHSLALRNDGTVFAWGYNGYGQLGDGTTTSRSTPVPVSLIGGLLALNGVTAIAAGGSHSLARIADGSLVAWGGNFFGQLGDGSTTNRLNPVPVPGLAGVVAIAAGDGHSVAVTANAKVVSAWGANESGQLGDGTTIERHTPVAAVQSYRVEQIGAGASHSLMLKGDGRVFAWGYNANGQLGDATTTNRSNAVATLGLSGFVGVAAGYAHSLALRHDGSVLAWGYNYDGQVGDGTTTTRTSPVQVTGMRNVVGVAAPNHGSLALKEDGTVWTWGGTPAQVAGISGVTSIAAGPSHALVVRNDGTVWGWGDNFYGQLGNAQSTFLYSPTQVPALAGVVAVSGGRIHSLALKSDGTVWIWGAFTGAGLTLIPVQVAGLSGVVAIAAGDNYSLALKIDGTVWGWGYNGNGQLGNGTTTSSTYSPVAVSGMNDVVSISAGKDGQNLAVKRDGTVWAWGRNDSRQQWDGTTSDRLVPFQVSGLPDIVETVTGWWHDLAITRDGAMVAWGANSDGALGDGTNVTRSTPAPVDDRFPENGILPAGWGATTDSGSPWSAVTDTRYAGSHALRSGVPGGGAARSGIQYAGNFRDGFVTFRRKVSSKAGADWLRFYVDGALKGEWSGELPWEKAGAFVPAGAHEIAWKYEKTVAGSPGAGSDAAWIDAVELPLAFNDAPFGHWAFDYINALKDAGITTGCGSGNFCAAQNVTREQMAAFIIRAVEGEPAACTSAPFGDVPISSPFCKYIQRMKDRNITTGCGGGNYCPGQNVTRDQMAAFIIRAREGEPAACTFAPYVDVETTNAFCPYVQRMRDLAITTGCGARRYCPAGVVTRDQMATFLARAFLGMP